jgi:hypothetical protein
MGGMMGRRGGFGGFGFRQASSTSSTPPIQGNGEPVVAGKVSGVSGATITVTNASNISYSVDTTNAKIVKDGATIALATVATGDNVVVQGVVNGTSITASSVIDQGTMLNQGGSGTSPTGGSRPGGGGIFGSIGNFFKHLFGF